MIDAQTIRPGTVNVLIGPNGSGKSRLLRKLCTSFLRSGDEVIAIAPTIYDRFRKMPKRGFRFYGARQGRNAAIYVIRSALERASAQNPRILKNLTRALEYTNFEPVIGIRLSGLNLDNFPAAEEHLSREEAESLRSALLKWQSRRERPNIVHLRMDSFSFEELDALTFAILARHDDLLHRTKTASRIEYFLYRKDEPIPLLEACSGEICFITTIAFISTQIESRSVIAIDEPDTSLHPTWQQSYVKTLLDLFHRYEPRILISTHSPIIISGAEAASGAVSVFEMKDGEASIFDHAKLSLEEMYDRLFGLITPKNHYLSQRAVTMLNALNSGDRNLNEVLHELDALRTKSYDESQQAVITKFEDMARRLEVMRQGRRA
jgi:predicted ATPase